MKTRTLLIPFAFAAILFSCNKNTGQKGADNQIQSTTQDSIKKANELEVFLQDSIKKVNELEVALFRQDSIEEAQIKKYYVKKISGKHKYGGVTKVQYQSLTQLIAEAKQQSKKEMWTSEKLQSTIDAYKSVCTGGAIRLDIERSTIGAADTEMFSIIIKGIDENELYRADLKSDLPETPIGNDYWWNIHTEWITKRIKKPFYVYVVDRLEDAPFKFEVTAIKK